MNKHVRLLYLLLLAFAFSISVASAQTTFGSEEELKTQAAKLFDDDQFEEAYPLYSQLTSIYPKDPNYNYRLGVCMLYASDDKEKPIAFLEFAVNKPEVEKEALFYLARAYHLNYRFDDAIKEYLLYKNVASSAKAEKLMVDRQIEMCRNGKKLLRNLTDLVVIEKKEMSRTDFFRSYDISGIGGKLLAKPDEDVFKTALDKKKKEKSIIYLASNNNQVFFSSYGDDPERGKDIYIIRKLPTGEWSKPQTLGYPVNTEYDEDFPFLHPNGKVLYFCSKGHNSMGGYDIFKTTLNEETDTWNKPVNLDFPINTPDDDILYVTNEDEKEAFFSSARASKTGKTAVYHINVERKPIDIGIIKGAIVKNRDNQALDVKITVKDLKDNEILGIFNSKANGVYLINIPNGGKFLFTVEAAGFATQSDIVDVPVQYVFRPMKQEISYETGTDKLIIHNLFDEVLDDASYLLALNFIKEKSKMDVNITDAPSTNVAVASKDSSATSDVVSNTAKDNSTSASAKLNNNDIVKIGYSDAEDVAKEAKDLKEQANVALVLANQKNELALNKSKEAEQLMNDASKMDDNVKKQATIEEANAATKEAEDLNQETVAAFNLAKKIEFRASAKEQEADLSLQYAKDLEAAVKSKKSDPALFAKLDEQQKKLDALAEQNNNPTLANSLKMDVDNKKRELDKAIQAVADIKQEISDNEALAITTQADADKEKNEKVKQGLIDQVAGLKMDTEDSKKDLALNEQKVAQLQKEYNGVVNETALVSNVYDKAKDVTNEKAAADVAMIDKEKLEQQVKNIKNSTASENAIAANTNKTSDTSIKTADVGIINSTKTTDNNAKTNDVVSVNTENKNGNNSIDNTNKNVDANTDNSTNISENSGDVKVDYAKKYSEDIAATEIITNELERENKKAELYKNWSASISDELAAKKEDVKTEKDKAKKKELNAEISALEKELKEKQKTTATTIASVEKLKKDGVVVADNTTKKTDINVSDNTSADNSTALASGNINKKYADEIAATKSIPNEVDQEKAKAAVLQNWSKAIDEDVAKKKIQMEASSDPEMKALLVLKIQQEEQQSIGNQKEAVISLGKAELLKNNPGLTSKTNDVAITTTQDNNVVNNTVKKNDVAVANTQDNNQANNTTKTNDAAFTTTQDNNLVNNTVKTNDVAVSNAQDNNAANNTTRTNDAAVTNTKDNNLTDNTAKTNNNIALKDVDSNTVGNTLDAVNASAEKMFAYKSSASADQAKKADVLNKQAEDFISQSNDLKSKAAAENNVTAKNAIYAEADELEKQSENKKTEAAQIVAVANKTEYLDNQNKLEQFAVATKGNTADDISIVELMKEDANLYFNRAQKSRDLANSASDYYEKETAFEDAYKNEMIALEKQKKATDIYLKYTSDVAVNNNKLEVDNTMANKSADNSSKTNNVVANNTIKTNDLAINNANTIKSVDTNKSADNTLINNTSKDNTLKTNDVVVNNSTDKNSTDNNVKTKDLTNNSTTNTAVTTNDVAVNNNIDNNVTNNTTKTKDQTANSTTSTVTNTNDVVATKLPLTNTNEVFVKTSTPVYSASKPIPVNSKLPEGLIFKVQIGAFRNPIPQDLFKGMSPITGETTPQGFTRYTAGLFTKFVTADKVKGEIRDLGYKDAFVVAFFNGKRISMVEALGMTGETMPVNDQIASNTIADNTSNTTDNSASNTTSQTTVNNTTTQAPVNNTATAQTTIPAVTQNVSVLSGLFYTVQVGVYSQPVSANKLHNIQPLYTETAQNGNLRYNTGIYNNIARAAEAKNMIVDAGIIDAFVTAYYNGKRISIPEAAQLISLGNAVFSNDPDINRLPTFSAAASQTVSNPVNNTFSNEITNLLPVKVDQVSNNQVKPDVIKTTTPAVSEKVKAESNASNTMIVDSGIVFKVQIGAFKEEVPLAIANKFLKIARMGVKNYKDANGLTIYTVGTFKSYAEANSVKADVVATANITDAFIVAYKDGIKISVEEAKTLIGN